jgi:hypothetical protein
MNYPGPLCGQFGAQQRVDFSGVSAPPRGEADGGR